MKCPSCNSSRIIKQVMEEKYVISCARCGFVNMRELNKSKQNETFKY